MSFIKTASALLSVISATVLMSAISADKANALSEVTLPSTIMIKSAHSNMVVDKFGDNPNLAAKAHLYSQQNPQTYTLRPIRSANGSYETQLASRPNLCFTAAGGLNPSMGNGTQAVFSGDCANSLNLRFYDDGTVRIARNTTMCLTNQGNRYNTPFNKLHFWSCDNSPETKWNFVGVGNPGVVYTPPAPVVQQNNPPVKQAVSNPVTTQNYNPNITIPQMPKKVLPNVPYICGPKVPWQVCVITATLKFRQFTNGMVTLSYDEMKAYLGYTYNDCPTLVSLGEQVARKSGWYYQFMNIHGTTVTFSNRQLY